MNKKNKNEWVLFIYFKLLIGQLFSFLAGSTFMLVCINNEVEIKWKRRASKMQMYIGNI